MNSYFPGIELPQPFQADWHHQLGPRLSVFPRYLAQLTQLDAAALELYWPDLATFVEDKSARQMMYYRNGSRVSFLVNYRQRVGSWQVVKFLDFEAVQLFAGRDFDKMVFQVAVAGCVQDAAS